MHQNTTPWTNRNEAPILDCSSDFCAVHLGCFGTRLTLTGETVQSGASFKVGPRAIVEVAKVKDQILTMLFAASSQIAIKTDAVETDAEELILRSALLHFRSLQKILFRYQLRPNDADRKPSPSIDSSETHCSHRLALMWTCKCRAATIITAHHAVQRQPVIVILNLQHLTSCTNTTPQNIRN